jgi:hypothetical protein
MSDVKTSKPIALGKFKPLLAGTSLARICAAALPGKYTVAQVAAAAGLPPDKVLRRLRRRFAAHGIGHNRADNGVITLAPARRRARRGAGGRRGEAGGRGQGGLDPDKRRTHRSSATMAGVFRTPAAEKGLFGSRLFASCLRVGQLPSFISTT